MLRLALGFEFKRLQRSWAGALAVIAFLTVGALAILVGQLNVAQWESALRAGAEAQESSIAEARGFFERGEAGPADRPWVDLSQPRWQDWYAATRVSRQPGALAGVAAGAIDSAPAVFRISRSADPLSAAGYQIENPELAVGAFDLVIVLALLLPLLVGVLGLDIGSRERETRLDMLVAVQAGAMKRWLIARMLAITLIASASAVGLCLAASLVGAASPVDTMLLSIVALIYAALWSGILLTINAQARSVRSSAFAFGSIWALLCVLIPALSAEFALGHFTDDFAAKQTLEARELRYATAERDVAEVLPAFYQRYPELTTAAAALEDPLDPALARDAHGAIVFASIEERHAVESERGRQAATLAERAAWASPAVAIALTLERLAGVGPEAAASYRDSLMRAVSDRVDWVVSRNWAKRPLDLDDFEALITDQAEFVAPERRALGNPVIALCIWTSFAWLLALRGLSRSRTSG